MNDLDKRRHSLAHLLAAAVLQHYPDTQLTLGPAIDTGFYYDFEFSKSISDSNLEKIEKTMKELLPSWKEFSHKEISVEEARELFKDNPYKLELVNEIADRGEAITLYTSGEFTDLCRGGHSDDMSAIDPESFSLDRVAGAYWRGDENNTMLTRIYGLSFETKEELVAFKESREQAKERDHRKIGKEMGLFTFSELVGAGLPMFTPKGTAMREAVIEKIHAIQAKYDYQEVWIPHITKPDLYKKSGHWDKFGDDLFHVKGKEGEFVIKPMNCPHHTQIYASEMRSYKDLPLRFTEATTVYRDEQSGELIGLGRVRSITQDDGHVFCTEEQIEEEISIIVKIIKEFYTLLEMFNEGNYWVSLSVRDPKTPEKFLGDDSVWETSEKALEKIAKTEGLEYKKQEGEAAFYGPKLDFMFKDSLGRERQLATVQLDFNMPNRFGLTYTDNEGKKQTPVMIHRAIAGSIERFLGIIIEHFAGDFPFWLAPVQVAVFPVKETHNEYAESIYRSLKESGIRATVDTSKGNLGKKVQKAKSGRPFYSIIVGDDDMEANKVTLESRDAGKLGQMTLEEALRKFS